jgi:hypothetical protein
VRLPVLRTVAWQAPSHAIGVDLVAGHTGDLVEARAGQQQQFEDRAERFVGAGTRLPEPLDLVGAQGALSRRWRPSPVEVGAGIRLDDAPFLAPCKHARQDRGDSARSRLAGLGVPSFRAGNAA